MMYGALTAVRNSYPAMAAFLSIVTLWGSGIYLTPATIFTTSLMLKTLADTVVQAVVEGGYSFSVIRTTIARLESFLTDKDSTYLDYIQKEGTLHNIGDNGGRPAGDLEKQRSPAPVTPEKGSKGPGIEMTNVSSYITAKKDSNEIILLNRISLQCKGNDLVAITGSAGSGKSSVLGAIIGETPVTSGEISVTGRIAYMPQNTWLYSGTVQENILFGNDYDEEKYRATIEACALIEDFKILPLGDMTQVGESGVSLSGGQRARVSLARTVYSDADIFLLDSPLKAVDAKVGVSIYQNCICGLLSSRPRIHITHHKKYLQNASVVLNMENGSIVHRKKPQYIEEENGVGADVKSSPDVEPEEDEGDDTTAEPSSGGEGISTADEDRAIGSVPIRTYMKYFHAGAPWLGVLITFLFVSIPGGECCF